MTAERVQGLRARLSAENVSAFCANDSANVAYLTGFSGVFDAEPATVAFVSQSSLVLFTDGRYAEAVSSAARGTAWEVRELRDDVWTGACETATLQGVERLGVEDSLTVSRFRKLEEMLEASVEPLAGWVEELRRVKSAEEIDRIAEAQALTDSAFDHLLGIVGAGVTERDLALDLEVYLRRNGSEGLAFPPIVAGGPNSALPHAQPSDRVLESGDFLTLDFGARVGGYCADMTRTLVIGSASERQREMYDAVLEANEAAIAAVAENARAADVDRAARSLLEKRGFGEEFSHGTGHGLGLDVHELPHVSSRNEAPLRKGEVITIEPGVYVAGFGGVRIEDLVVVEGASARVLTTAQKGLIEA